MVSRMNRLISRSLLVCLVGLLLLAGSIDTFPDPPASRPTISQCSSSLLHQVWTDQKMTVRIPLPLVEHDLVEQTAEPSHSNPVIRAIYQMANVSPPLA
jgi:hypothetical protein